MGGRVGQSRKEINKFSADFFLFPGIMELPTKPEIVVLLGRPETGKSYAIRSLIYQYAKAGLLQFGVCITPTKYNGTYTYLPDKWVWEGYDEERLEKYIVALRRKQGELKKKGKELPPNFVILDDCLGTINMQSAFFSNWIACFRHTNTTVFITAQSLKGKGTSTLLRDCTTRALMYRTNFKIAMQGLYDAYGQVFEDYDEFKEHFQAATQEQYHCLVFENNKDSFEETYYGWKAEEVPDFQLKYLV